MIARDAIAGGLCRLLEHEQGARRGDDPEDVHQARVATRRLRSDLKTFAAAFAGDVSALRDEVAWLGGCLGAVRDADVLLERLRANGAPEAVVARLCAERDAARVELVSAMDGERYRALVTALREAEAADVSDAALVKVVRRRWKQLKDAHSALGSHPEDDALHELRIRAKRARYAAEASSPALGKPVARMAKALAGLQGALGDLQDAVVAETWLTRTARAPRVSRDVAFACGVLVGRERDAQAAARQTWPEAWDDVVAARKRWSC